MPSKNSSSELYKGLRLAYNHIFEAYFDALDYIYLLEDEKCIPNVAPELQSVNKELVKEKFVTSLGYVLYDIGMPVPLSDEEKQKLNSCNIPNIIVRFVREG